MAAAEPGGGLGARGHVQRGPSEGPGPDQDGERELQGRPGCAGRRQEPGAFFLLLPRPVPPSTGAFVSLGCGLSEARSPPREGLTVLCGHRVQDSPRWATSTRQQPTPWPCSLVWLLCPVSALGFWNPSLCRLVAHVGELSGAARL